VAPAQPPPPAAVPAAQTVVPPQAEAPVDFVCEDDVRQALAADRRIVVNERTIITPAARDLGEPRRIFVQAELPR
jgi:hypothetical protein